MNMYFKWYNTLILGTTGINLGTEVSSHFVISAQEPNIVVSAQDGSGNWQNVTEITLITPVPLFIDNGDGTMTDEATGLMWIQDASTINSGATLNWVTASMTCEAMNTGGYNDWRLPTKEELEGIVNLKDNQTGNKSNIGTWLNDEGFVNINKDYWSSTEYSDDLAWSVDFKYGIFFNSGHKVNDNYFRAWCVRSGL